MTQRRDIPRLVRDGGAELSQLAQSEASQGWASVGAATGSKMPVCLGFSHSLLPSSPTNPSTASHRLPYMWACCDRRLRGRGGGGFRESYRIKARAQPLSRFQDPKNRALNATQGIIPSLTLLKRMLPTTLKPEQESREDGGSYKRRLNFYTEAQGKMVHFTQNSKSRTRQLCPRH